MKKLRCPSCNSLKIIKKGKQKRNIGFIQRYQCKKCKKVFINKIIKNILYPANVIFQALNIYNIGYNLDETTKMVNKKFKIKTNRSTIYSWINKYKDVLPAISIRHKFTKPDTLLFSKSFEHENLEYLFMYHKYKLAFYGKKFPRLIDYIKGFEKGCPDLFFEIGKRCSQPLFKVDIKPVRKKNLACHMAGFTAKAARVNRDRHNMVESFMLINDKATVACEIPVWYWEKSVDSGITGHIDILQIRGEKVFILDYKPDASKEKKAVQQLYHYAVALGFRTGVPFEKIMCAWFDENDYFEYCPADADASLIRK